jgi:hypothetical protein
VSSPPRCAEFAVVTTVVTPRQAASSEAGSLRSPVTLSAPASADGRRTQHADRLARGDQPAGHQAAQHSGGTNDEVHGASLAAGRLDRAVR